MTLTGHIQNGVVVFDGQASLPEGTEVEVAVRDSASDSRPTLWDRLGDVVGRAAGLPADASTRTDHRLVYGSVIKGFLE